MLTTYRKEPKSIRPLRATQFPTIRKLLRLRATSRSEKLRLLSYGTHPCEPQVKVTPYRTQLLPRLLNPLALHGLCMNVPIIWPFLTPLLITEPREVSEPWTVKNSGRVRADRLCASIKTNGAM